MAKPKLALIPAAQGSELFSVLPSSGVGDFDFIRTTSATRINSKGLIEEVATKESRLNYPMIDGKVVGCPHHILEPARTNLIGYSDDFSQYSDVSGADIFSNTTISPDGTLNASRVGFGSSEFSRIFINTSTSSNTYTFTLYAKSDTSKKFRFRISDSSGTQYSEDFITTSKWQRFSYEFIGDPSTCAICNSSDSNSGSIDIFGFQLEQGSYPTSYIKSDTGSPTTRSAETATGSGNADTFNDSEGVLMAEISALPQTSRIALNDGTTSNNVRFVYDAGANRIDGIVFNGSNQFASQYTLPTQGSFNKISLKYKPNDFALWVNGFKVGSLIGSGSTFTEGTLSELDFDAGSNGVLPFYGSTKQIQYYDSALTDIELEQLTSWTSFTDMAQAQQYSIK